MLKNVSIILTCIKSYGSDMLHPRILKELQNEIALYNKNLFLNGHWELILIFKTWSLH